MRVWDRQTLRRYERSRWRGGRYACVKVAAVGFAKPSPGVFAFWRETKERRHDGGLITMAGPASRPDATIAGPVFGGAVLVVFCEKEERMQLPIDAWAKGLPLDRSC